MYHVSAQGVDERMMNVHYYYYYVKFLCRPLLPVRFRPGISVTADYGAKNLYLLGVKYQYPARGKSGHWKNKNKKQTNNKNKNKTKLETLN